MTIISKRKFGEQQEQQANEFLTAQGLKLLARNFSCKFGEIDLIMQDHEFLVFVEVRYRQHQDYGTGLESVTHNKQRKIINSAQCYLSRNKLRDAACRFDVVAITDKQGILQFNWIKDAFWQKF
jgi:putative endonuclease